MREYTYRLDFKYHRIINFLSCDNDTVLPENFRILRECILEILEVSAYQVSNLFPNSLMTMKKAWEGMEQGKMLTVGSRWRVYECLLYYFNFFYVWFFLIEGRNHVGKTSEGKSKKRISNKNYTEFNQLKLARS